MNWIDGLLYGYLHSLTCKCNT